MKDNKDTGEQEEDNNSKEDKEEQDNNNKEEKEVDDEEDKDADHQRLMLTRTHIFEFVNDCFGFVNEWIFLDLSMEFLNLLMKFFGCDDFFTKFFDLWTNLWRIFFLQLTVEILCWWTQVEGVCSAQPPGQHLRLKGRRSKQLAHSPLFIRRKFHLFLIPTQLCLPHFQPKAKQPLPFSTKDCFQKGVMIQSELLLLIVPRQKVKVVWLLTAKNINKKIKTRMQVLELGPRD